MSLHITRGFVVMEKSLVVVVVDKYVYIKKWEKVAETASYFFYSYRWKLFPMLDI